MSRAVFIFGLCLTLVGVGMGDEFAWIPSRVPTPAEQCTRLDRCRGICGNGPRLASPDICKGVMCADQIIPNRMYFLPITIAVIDGTICGGANVCKEGECKRIPVSKVPTQYGVWDSFYCDITRGHGSHGFYDRPIDRKENVKPPCPNRQ